MAFTDTQALVALLKLDDKFSGPLKSAQKTLGQFDANLTKTSNRAFKAGQQIGTGIRNGVKIAAIGVGFLATNVAIGLRSLIGLEKVTTQTNAVLKSTKGAAGQTADSIRKMAEHFESLNATMDDTAIQSGANVLLTFTNIKKDAFEPTLLAALDLSQAMGQDLQTSIVQVGKAMNDPIVGLTALRRIGVAFTEDQVAQIKALTKSGDLMGAQKIILAELNKEFGGSFIAGGTTTAGKVALFTDSIEDLQRALATALLPTIGIVADKLTTFLSNPALAGQVTELGRKIAGLFSDSNLKTGGEVLTGLFNAAKAAAGPLQSAAEVTGRVVGAAVNMFKSLPPELQAVLVGGLAVNKLTGGLVTNIAGGAVDAVGGLLGHFLERGSSPANPLFVAQVGGIPGLPGTGAGPGGGLPGAIAGAGLIPIIGTAVVAAVGAQAIADQTNKDFANAGTPTNFMAPGSGVLPFGIEASINNIAEFVRIATGRKPLTPEQADSDETASHFRNVRGVGRPAGGPKGSAGPLGPQGVGRIIGSTVGHIIAPPLGRGANAAGRSATASRAAAAAIKAKRLISNVRVMNTVKVENSLNGRVFSAQLNRYVNIYSNSGQFGGTGPR